LAKTLALWVHCGTMLGGLKLDVRREFSTSACLYRVCWSLDREVQTGVLVLNMRRLAQVHFSCGHLIEACTVLASNANIPIVQDVSLASIMLVAVNMRFRSGSRAVSRLGYRW
jgi:hypothetical protein